MSAHLSAALSGQRGTTKALCTTLLPKNLGEPRNNGRGGQYCRGGLPLSAVLFRSGFGSLTPPSDGCPAGSGDAAKPHGAALAAHSPGSWLPTVSFTQSRKPDLDRIRQRVGRAPSSLAWVSLHSVPGDLDFPSGEGRAEGAGLCGPHSALRRRRCVAAAGTGLREPGGTPHPPSTVPAGSSASPGSHLQTPPLRQPRAPRPRRHRPSRLKEGASIAPPPLPRGRGTGWGTQAGISASWGWGVFSPRVPGAGALGEGAGGGGRELEPVCRGAAEWNRWLGAGERVRGGEEEAAGAGG